MTNKTQNDLFCLREKDENIKNISENLRLGSFPCELVSGSKSATIYGKDLINERHRHRFEFNNKYIELFERNGMKVAGFCKENNYVEILENTNSTWMIGVQFHPEFLSRPVRPHPLFIDFVNTAIIKKHNN